MRRIDGDGPLGALKLTAPQSFSKVMANAERGGPSSEQGRKSISSTKTKAIFIVAPDGQAGGGMGQVKDYILRAGGDAAGRYAFVPLITRDGKGAVYSLWLLALCILSIWKSALTGHAALVHVHMGDFGSAGRKGLIVLASRLVGVPTVLHFHAVSMEPWYARANGIVRWALRQPFRAATVVVVLGERFRRWMVEELDVDPAKIDILHNGVANRKAMSFTRGGGNRPVEILFLGNLIERKGVSDLIAALAMLPPDLGDWHVSFAGGGDLDHYRQLAGSNGIADKVSFLGWVDREGALDLLERADILALPSYEEGLPLVILEALGAGVPVLCTPVGSIPEVLTDGDDALFCNPGDRPAMAACLARLIADPALRDELASAGSALFERQFSLEAFQNALFDIYDHRCGVRFVPARDPAPEGIGAG
ncbi:glycosyltransferase family 4 protein [Sphingobium sp. H39-3-25]|uniref:glycosyltransferase family 4 protein n=1 Tax=Sphingobium arseniciresistens TaxID=3030834 RepID=UPI0023B90280|nr:glycosyltransferase family 4 protein [Sphingobium arseniciresistens]